VVLLMILDGLPRSTGFCLELEAARLNAVDLVLLGLSKGRDVGAVSWEAEGAGMSLDCDLETRSTDSIL